MKFKTERAYNEEVARRRKINHTISKKLSRGNVISQVKGGNSRLFEKISQKSFKDRILNIDMLLKI
jgi:hypothetical protein